jgi:hypothetical protein
MKSIFRPDEFYAARYLILRDSYSKNGKLPFILDQIIDQCESESQARVLCKDIDTPKEGQRVTLCN